MGVIHVTDDEAIIDNAGGLIFGVGKSGIRDGEDGRVIDGCHVHGFADAVGIQGAIIDGEGDGAGSSRWVIARVIVSDTGKGGGIVGKGCTAG